MKLHSWYRSGSPWIWLNAGALAFSLIMVLGLLVLIGVRGFGHFWPSAVVQFQLLHSDGSYTEVLGEKIRSEQVSRSVLQDSGIQLAGSAPSLTRYLIRVGNRDLDSRDFRWYLQDNISNWHYPENALVLQRREWGPFYGIPIYLREGDNILASGADIIPLLAGKIRQVQQRYSQIKAEEKSAAGELHQQMRRLQQQNIAALSQAELDAHQLQYQSIQQQFQQLYEQLEQQYQTLQHDTLELQTAEGEQLLITLVDILGSAAPNQMTMWQKISHYVRSLWLFLSEAPREANTEGGIFPALIGTVVMVLLMSVLVTPLGVLAAVYLHEYASQGWLVRLVRLSVYNLAGVPSIVFGVFGLGFFVYIVGGSIDQLLFSDTLPSPTFGTPGLFWASLTLALLTLPVVIVSTEEGLARIPASIRMGSLALGATQSETLWRVVLPLTVPAMLTGLILAVARAAGEVAPLMLVGVVKLAPTLPVSGEFPFVHLDQKIMHLGFHIYDAALQSPNVEAAMPLVYATAMVLIALIMTLNISAIIIRNRLREKYRSDFE